MKNLGEMRQSTTKRILKPYDSCARFGHYIASQSIETVGTGLYGLARRVSSTFVIVANRRAGYRRAGA